MDIDLNGSDDDPFRGIEVGDRVRYRPDDCDRSQPGNTDDDGYVYGTVDRRTYETSYGEVAVNVLVDEKYYNEASSIRPDPLVNPEYLEVID